MTKYKMPSDKTITIRLPQHELEHFEAYCAKAGRTKTDVLREMIRKLKV